MIIIAGNLVSFVRWIADEGSWVGWRGQVAHGHKFLHCASPREHPLPVDIYGRREPLHVHEARLATPNGRRKPSGLRVWRIGQ